MLRRTVATAGFSTLERFLERSYTEERRADTLCVSGRNLEWKPLFLTFLKRILRWNIALRCVIQCCFIRCDIYASVVPKLRRASCALTRTHLRNSRRGAKVGRFLPRQTDMHYAQWAGEEKLRSCTPTTIKWHQTRVVIFSWSGSKINSKAVSFVSRTGGGDSLTSTANKRVLCVLHPAVSCWGTHGVKWGLEASLYSSLSALSPLITSMSPFPRR